jgi:hypothetical protein
MIATALWLAAAVPAMSQVQGEPLIVGGACEPTSGVSIDDAQTSNFACDNAVIARTERGTVLIQFADKSGDDGRILGFAGTIEGKQGLGADPVQTVGVERLHLAGGAEPIPVSRGSCFMSWTGLQRTGGQLTSVVCGAFGRAEGSDIKAVAALKVR